MEEPPKQQQLPTTDDPAVARKRRKEILTSLRANEEDEERSAKRRCSQSLSSSDDDEDAPGKPSIRGIKKQARYVPGVPMTKEQLREWRKEARRVRNRESAAASRKKTRSRIQELEGELSNLQSKYSEALKHIAQLQQGAKDSFIPDKLRQDLMEFCTKAPISAMPSTPVSPTTAPQVPMTLPSNSESLLLPGYQDTDSPQTILPEHHTTTVDMISRPTDA